MSTMEVGSDFEDEETAQFVSDVRLQQENMAKIEETPKQRGGGQTNTQAMSTRKRRKNERGSPVDPFGGKDIEMNSFDAEIKAHCDFQDIEKKLCSFLAAKRKARKAVDVDVSAEILNFFKEADRIAARLALQNAALKGKIAELQNAQRDTLREYQVLTRNSSFTVPPVTGMTRPPPPRTYAAVIRPASESEQMTDKELKEKIEKAVCPHENGLRITRVKRTRSGVAVETVADEDLQKLLSSQALSEVGLKISLPKARMPRVIVYDVPTAHSEEYLRQCLRAQNFDKMIGGKDIKIEEEVNFKFRTGPKGQERVHWVLEVSPRVRNLLRSERRVFFGLFSCKVSDYTAISRCYKCQGVGHIAQYCRATEQTCGYCAKEGHKMENCLIKKANGPRTCALCKRANKPHSHAADNNCPTYKLIGELQLKNIDYGA